VASGTWLWDLVELAAAQAARDNAGMDGALARLRAAGREREVEEALLQSYLFLGYPAAIEAFRLWRAQAGGPPREPPGAAGEDEGSFARRGEAVCARVYGGRYERLRENIARFHPDLDRWMVVEGYGKVLGRPGLSLEVRELLIVAMLVVQGASARRQLRSHLQGALNAGAAAADVEMAIERAARFASPESAELARKTWAGVARDR
jgi:4-carboxymuconolactone decarboxylase